MDSMQIWWSEIQSLLLSIGFMVLGFFFHAFITRTNAMAASQRGKIILDEAEKKAKAIEHEAEVKAREEVLAAREKAEHSLDKKRQSIIELEDRVVAREKDISRKLELLETKDRTLSEKLDKAEEQQETIIEQKKVLDERIAQENQRIQEIADFSKDDARKIIMEQMETELEGEISGLIRHQQKTAHEQARAQAREIVCSAIERYAGEHVSNITTTQVQLPSDDMKGRIIGKEGRNIRSFETESGVNLIIDETPGVVLLSSYDPVRREVARVALERLLEDGRIHPASIEQTLEKVRSEINELIRQAGEDALYNLGISGVDPELVKILGRLKYRTSYKQNVLEHSVEMASLMAMMAADLDLDVSTAKRVGVFHDLGKAVDHEVEGSHAVIGANLLRKYGEEPIVYNAVAAHHDDVEKNSVYAVLAAAADAITAARPGARLDSTDLYLERLDKMEKIAKSFKGVDKSYAIQAGRELRVIVEGKQVDDNRALVLAREIANTVQNEVRYPGQVKVTVIRETRAIEYAK
ncbi:ribonuclease Y [Tichowtungia aerotolerans]|uniref:Ribonuclease Y n=1 Tax=Tichowtungia aerotolerans TaxID=2697043 RepID=A0A6P1MD36_9BACT|nr:ribonuclease Y [Tichowtungia aerotolerans]QHI69506.1 ribonuclease Y [Tichowtungia aerotolerans]